MSRSSPTTTSAVNENRRPPLTTLATRLISTTRSWRSRPAEETVRSRSAISSPRVAMSLETLWWRLAAAPSERQPALAGPVGERFDAPVVLVSAAVEHHGVDPGRLGAVGQQCAGAGGLLHRSQAAQLGLDPV